MRLATFTAAVRKDLRRFLSDRIALATSLGIPLLIGAFMALAFGGDDGPVPRGRLVIVDEDDSFVSGLLAGAFGQGELREMIATEPAASVAAGLERVEHDGAAALLRIPAGFGDAVLTGEATTLKLWKNPAMTIVPDVVESVLELVADAARYVEALAGDEIARIVALAEGGRAPGVTDSTPIEISLGFQRLGRRLASHLDPPLLGFETSHDEDTTRRTQSAGSFALVFAPGILFMALFFLAQSLAEDIWRERQMGTLRRSATLATGFAPVLYGKLAAAAVLFALLAAVAIAAGTLWLGLPLAQMPGAWLMTTAFGVALLAFLLLLQTLARSQRAGAILGSVVMLPLLMLGGSFFPFEFMPDGLAAVGKLTPNGLALAQLLAELESGPNLLRLGVTVAAELATAAVLTWLVVRRLGRVLRS